MRGPEAAWPLSAGQASCPSLTASAGVLPCRRGQELLRALRPRAALRLDPPYLLQVGARCRPDNHHQIASRLPSEDLLKKKIQKIHHHYAQTNLITVVVQQQQGDSKQSFKINKTFKFLFIHCVCRGWRENRTTAALFSKMTQG